MKISKLKSWQKGGLIFAFSDIILIMLATIVTSLKSFLYIAYSPLGFMSGLFGILLLETWRSPSTIYVVLGVGLIGWTLVGMFIGWLFSSKLKMWLKCTIFGFMFGWYNLLLAGLGTPLVIKQILFLPTSILIFLLTGHPWTGEVCNPGMKICLGGLFVILLNPWGWAIIGLIGGYLFEKFRK